MFIKANSTIEANKEMKSLGAKYYYITTDDGIFYFLNKSWKNTVKIGSLSRDLNSIYVNVSKVNAGILTREFKAL